MTRAQANAMMVALAGQKMNADATMRFDAAGNETWGVTLDPSVTYTGAMLAQLTAYCTQQGLILSMKVDAMGVV